MARRNTKKVESTHANGKREYNTRDVCKSDKDLSFIFVSKADAKEKKFFISLFQRKSSN
jgi:hypothetical protein